MEPLALLLTCGCYRWREVSSASEIHDESVLVEIHGSEVELDHATGRDQAIHGIPRSSTSALVPTGDCASPCGSLDVSHARVLAQRADGPATAAVIAAILLALPGTALAALLIGLGADQHAR